MTNDRFDDRIREAAWRRKPNPVEEPEVRGYLSAHPDFQADWEAEIALTQAIESLPDAPMPSNFTARVLQSAGCEANRAVRSSLGRASWWRIIFGWLPRTAVAAVCLGLGVVTYHHLQDTHRERLAQSVVTVSEVASVPSTDALADFEVIRALDQTPPADEELLRLMQ